MASQERPGKSGRTPAPGDVGGGGLASTWPTGNKRRNPRIRLWERKIRSHLKREWLL